MEHIESLIDVELSRRESNPEELLLFLKRLQNFADRYGLAAQELHKSYPEFYPPVYRLSKGEHHLPSLPPLIPPEEFVLEVVHKQEQNKLNQGPGVLGIRRDCPFWPLIHNYFQIEIMQNVEYIEKNETKKQLFNPLRYQDGYCMYCFAEVIINYKTAEIACTKCGLLQTTDCSNETSKNFDGRTVSFDDQQYVSTETRNAEYDKDKYMLKQLYALRVGIGRNTYPAEVKDAILLECKKYRFNPKMLRWQRAREYMSARGYCDSYKSVHQIVFDINGFRPPYPDDVFIEQVLEIFTKVRSVFQDLRNERVSMIAYDFIIHMTAILVNRPEFLEYFQLSTTKKSLDKVIARWKIICKVIGIEFKLSPTSSVIPPIARKRKIQ